MEDSDKGEADVKLPEEIGPKAKDKKGSIPRDKKLIKKKPKDNELKKGNLDTTIESKPDLSPEMLSEAESKTEDLSSIQPSSTSETKPLSKETKGIKSSDDNASTLENKEKTDKKMTMEEKIAAKKAKKEVKAEEPVFAGMKLKKSKPVQRQLKDQELEVVELKAHKFEQIPQIEMVKSLYEIH